MMRIAVLAAFAFSACGHVAPPQVDVLALPDTTDTGGPYELTVAIRAEAPIVRAAVFRFIQSDAARPIALEHRDGDRWSAQLPGEPVGTEVRYRVEVQDDEGNVVLRPPHDQGDGAYRFIVVAPRGGG